MKTHILVAMLLVAGMTNAQIKLTGVVKDSIGNPLEMANVIALNTQTKLLDSYGFTDAKGRYKLTLKKNTSYTIKASYIGNKTADVLIETKVVNLVKDIVLLPDTTLEEVNISYKMPVTIKGDTIVYDADSFKVGTEKKLGDVLKRLPGVEVNADGEIEVEGKKVNKVMVEGKDFFDGDTKVATQNIPANAIDKVEILKNFSEVNQLRSVSDNQDNVAINIKLKEGKKNFWFGEITAGLGPDNRFIAHPKLFYYSPKYSLNFITDMNNIGKIPFTRRDYFRFSGGFGRGGSSGTSFNVASSDIGFLSLQNNKAKEVDAKFAAANFSYSPKKTWDISGFAIYSGTETTLEQRSTRSYIEPDPDVSSTQLIETTNSNTNQDSTLGLFKLSSSYKPNVNNHLDYDLFAKVSKQTENQRFLSSEVSGDILELNEQSPFSFNQNLNYYYTLSDQHIFSFGAQHLWQDENPFYNAALEELSFANLLSLTTPGAGNGYDVSQDKRIKTNKLDSKLDYYYVINSKSNLNITLGTTLSSQQFNSSIFETLNGNEAPIAATSTINDVDYAFSDLYAGLHYKFITGIFTFTQGVAWHSYSAKNTQLGAVVDDNFTELLPDFSVKLQLKKSETLRLSYSKNVSFTDIYNVSEGFVLNNYNSLYAGNRELESALSHNIRLNYFSFNMFNYTNVFAFVNYNKRINSITRDTRVGGINQISTSVNSIFPNESLSGSLNMQKTIGKIKGSVGGNFSFSKSTNTISSLQDTDNDPATPKVLVSEDRASESFSQTYKTKISSNFRTAPNFEFGYNVSISDYDQGGNVNTYVTHSPFLNLDVLFLEDFTFTSRYTYNNYKDKEKTINEYSFLDVDLTYQQGESKWEFGLEMINVLNTLSINKDSSNAIFNSTSSYVIQPRYTVFSVKYNL